MRLLVLPGVFHPISDTWLLARVLREHVRPGAAVADVCTGSGALAVTAALAGAGAVTGIDVSRRAVACAWLNARLNETAIRVRRGDLLAPLAGERFDVIVSNPPYVPAPDGAVPHRGPERAWDAGHDGRVLLDRLIAQAPDNLRPGGSLLVVQSTIIGERRTLEALEARGLRAEVVARESGPLGRLMAARAGYLERVGLLPEGRRDEEVLVIRGTAPVHARGEEAGDERGRRVATAPSHSR